MLRLEGCCSQLSSSQCGLPDASKLRMHGFEIMPVPYCRVGTSCRHHQHRTYILSLQLCNKVQISYES